MRALATALLLLVPSALTAQTRWFEALDEGFRISIPTSYQTNSYTEGTDVIHGFMSPDENVAIRIRTVPLPQQVDPAMVIGLVEESIFSGAQRLVIQDYELNGLAGQMAGYRWQWQGTPVVVGAFYAQVPGRFYVMWSAIPENLFQARTGESDAILNTFTLVQAAANTRENPPASIGGSVGSGAGGASAGGSVTPPATPTRPQTGGQGANAAYTTLVEETAGLEFSIPVGFEMVDSQQGQQIWQGPAGGEDAEVRMVIQTIDKSPGDYSNVEEAYITLMGQVRDNSSATEVDKRRVRSSGGLDVPVYAFDLRQGQGTIRFVYAIAETRGHITMVSFLGPVQRAYRQEMHADEAANSMAATGGQQPPVTNRPPATSRPPTTNRPPAATDLSGPAGPHVVTLAQGNDRSGAGSAASGYRFWGQNHRFRVEMPTGWSDDGYSGSQLSWDRFSKPGAQAGWRLTQVPQSARSFDEVVEGLGDSYLGTATLNGHQFHASQSVRHMGPPTNMRLRSDCLTWFNLRTTYSLCFEGDASTWNTHVRPVAEHMLSSLTILGG